MNEKIFSTKEAATRLNCSLENIYRLTLKGQLTPVKMYSRNFFTEAELARWENLRSKKSNRQITEA